MPKLHPLDLAIADAWPDLSSAAAVQAFEATPYDQRIAAASTYAALQRGAAINPDAPAIIFLPNADPDEPGQRISHAQFMAGVTQAANLFSALGVGPDDVVSVLLPLLPQSFFAIFGAEAVGIANPVNSLLEAGQIAEILHAANTRVLVAQGPGSDIWAKVERIRDRLPQLKAVLVVGGSGPAPEGTLAFDALLAQQPAGQLSSGRQIRASDTAAYFHTGGTTGLPKLVRHSHGNQVYQAWAMALMLQMRPAAPMLCGLPLFHVGGGLTQGLAPLAAGGTLVVLSALGWRSPAAVRNVWRLVERFRPDVFGGVPTVLGAALTVPLDGADVSSVRCIWGGGSAIPVPVGQAYERLFKAPVLEVYGMTETASVHAMSNAQRPLRIGTVGQALPYSRLRVVVVDATGQVQRDCAVDEIGVVAMAGPGVFTGYLSESHNRDAFVAPGWVNSGDLGRLDAEGYLWITGRAKDLIIRGGHNIDPMAIEEVFFGHPAVALACVVGAPDAYAGELPVAYVQLKPGASVSADELLDHVRQHTPERAAVPVALYFVDSVPQTAVGKVFKPALRLDAAQRAVTRLLAGMAPDAATLRVEVGAHPVHGSLITVTLGGVAEPQRAALGQAVSQRLDPLTLRHALVWA